MRQIPETFITELNKTIDSEIYGRSLPALQVAEVIFHPMQFSYQYDYGQRRITAMNGNLRRILGYHPPITSDIFDLAIQLSLNATVQERNVLNGIKQKAMEFFLIQKKKGELKSLNFSFEYKVKRIRGDYAWLLHQMTVLSTGYDGSPQISVNTITDITSQKRDDKTCFTFSKMGEDMLYAPIHSINDSVLNNTPGLSERELEILELLRLGKSSHEISESLFISTHTVNTHRKNMLKKAGAKNTAELLFVLSAA